MDQIIVVFGLTTGTPVCGMLARCKDCGVETPVVSHRMRGLILVHQEDGGLLTIPTTVSANNVELDSS